MVSALPDTGAGSSCRNRYGTEYGTLDSGLYLLYGEFIADFREFGQVAEWFKAAVLKTAPENTLYGLKTAKSAEIRTALSAFTVRSAGTNGTCDGTVEEVMAATEWRSKQKAYRDEASGLPLARGSFFLHEAVGGYDMESPDGHSRFIAGDLPAAHAVMASAHHAWREALPDEPPPPPTGHIYFVGEAAEVGAMVKIGYTVNPKSRLGNLQVGSPRRLQLLATIPGRTADEARYHAEFRPLWSHGEWFKIDDALLAEIERLSFVAIGYSGKGKPE